MSKMNYEDWCASVEDELSIELAENGADREPEFDTECEYEKRYEKYLEE